MISKNRILLLARIALTLILLGCSSDKRFVTVQIFDKSATRSINIAAEVVCNESTRSLGLMYRKHLGETEGMLFVFPGAEERSFWMKNTYLPLDIVFIDKDFRVDSIIENATPHSLEPRRSKGPAKYVLEVAAGSSKVWGLEPGSVIKVLGDLPQPS